MTTKLILALTEMSPNGTNDLLILNDSFELIEVIEEMTFGYPSNTAVMPDLSIDYTNTIGGLDELNDPEMQEAGIQGLYTVSIDQVLGRIAVSPVDNGGKKVSKLKALGLI